MLPQQRLYSKNEENKEITGNDIKHSSPLWERIIGKY